MKPCPKFNIHGDMAHSSQDSYSLSCSPLFPRLCDTSLFSGDENSMWQSLWAICGGGLSLGRGQGKYLYCMSTRQSQKRQSQFDLRLSLLVADNFPTCFSFSLPRPLPSPFPIFVFPPSQQNHSAALDWLGFWPQCYGPA